MTFPHPRSVANASYRAKVALAFALLVLLSACGGGQSETTTDAAAPTSEQAPDTTASAAESASAAANANQATLQSTADSVFDVEVLRVADGSVATLNDVVDGDRPVLLWFWAPH